MTADQPKQWIIPVAAVILFALYMSAYYALMKPRWLFIALPGPGILVPEYRYGGHFAETVFAPANWLDRIIRRQRWEAEDYRPSGR
jgi:hypothetical protein